MLTLCSAQQLGSVAQLHPWVSIHHFDTLRASALALLKKVIWSVFMKRIKTPQQRLLPTRLDSATLITHNASIISLSSHRNN